MATEPINIDHTLEKDFIFENWSDGVLDSRIVTKVPSRRVQDQKPGSSSSRRKDGSREYPMKAYGRYGRSKVWPRTSFITNIVDTPDNTGHTVYTDGMFVGEALPSYQPFDDSIIWKAEVDALERLKNSKASLGVALGERKEAALLVSSSAERIVKSVHDVIETIRFKRGPKTAAEFWQQAKGLGSKGVRGIPEAWLEVQYGWNPLLSDVDSAMSALSDRDSLYPDRNVITVRGRSRKTEVTRDIVYDTNINGNYGREVTTTRNVKCQVTLQYEMIEALAHVLPYKSMGLTNPLSIAWELVPFSFAADWLLPVGTWLDTFDANLGLTFSQGCRGYLETVEQSEGPIANYRGGPQPPSYLAFMAPGSARLVDFTRSLYHSSPIPAFPSFKDPLSLGHMANALSILSSVFSSKKPPYRRYS